MKINSIILSLFVLFCNTSTMVYAHEESAPVHLTASSPEAKKRFKLFHYFVYYPVHVVAFILTGPIVIVTSVVQHHDDKLKGEAE